MMKTASNMIGFFNFVVFNHTSYFTSQYQMSNIVADFLNSKQINSAYSDQVIIQLVK